MSAKPVIGLVQGDPAGIGPELMVKLLSDEEVKDRAHIVIIGDPSVIKRGEEVVGASIPRQHINEFNKDVELECCRREVIASRFEDSVRNVEGRAN